MSLPEAARVVALAQRLALTPRQLLALAARAARSDAAPDLGWLERGLDGVHGATDAADAAAERLLLGHAGYALDDIDQGLRLAWSGVERLDP